MADIQELELQNEWVIFLILILRTLFFFSFISGTISLENRVRSFFP